MHKTGEYMIYFIQVYLFLFNIKIDNKSNSMSNICIDVII